MREIFVFGSNLAGRHGAGAAKTAREKHGARCGVGRGFTGQSYAIPTKGTDMRTLPLEEIRQYVERFLYTASCYPEIQFNVTRIGCGLAGYKDKDIAPMFAAATPNVILPKAWGGSGFGW